jgi:hypothetical protein
MVWDYPFGSPTNAHRIANPGRGVDLGQKLIYDGNVSTGAADDLQRATEVALEMVTIAHAFGRTVEILKSRRAESRTAAAPGSLTVDDFPALRPTGAELQPKPPAVDTAA